jgi:transposase
MEVQMGKTRPQYPAEYREQIVALHRSGRSVTSLARDFEPSVWTIRNWIREANKEDEGPPADETLDAEVKRLRQEVRQLKMERDILEKATAWFAQKTVPKSSSDS